jgi:hypothetical protein
MVEILFYFSAAEKKGKRKKIGKKNGFFSRKKIGNYFFFHFIGKIFFCLNIINFREKPERFIKKKN